MKYSIVFIFIFLLTSCKAQQQKDIDSFVKTTCPDNATCSFEIIKNSTLLLHKSDWSAYTTIEKGNNIVFKFIFARDVDKRMMDAHYIETIYAEFPKEITSLQLKDKELSKVNLIFNRDCYCKGSYGSFLITKGELNLKKIAKNKYQITINFKVDEVPQVITSISEILILK